jgi:hypothetical protein
MQQMYYVSHDGKEHGPWTVEQIVSKMKSGHVEMTDYVYDESKQDWVLLMEFAPLADALKGKKPKAPPKSARGSTEDDEVVPFGEKTVIAEAKETPTQTHAEEWYVLKWDNRYGPFTFVDVIKMLQDKSVFEFDYVWKPGFEAWKRIAEVKDFTPDNIRQLKHAGAAELSEVFFRRRHVRTQYNGSIIIHDTKNVWKGESFEISEGGAGLVMHNALVLPGQKIFLHFKPGDNVPPFNAVCEIVSKQYVKGVKQREAPIGYGVKFVEIHGDAQKAIRHFTTKAA